jgi:hypothetical protein
MIFYKCDKCGEKFNDIWHLKFSKWHNNLGNYDARLVEIDICEDCLSKDIGLSTIQDELKKQKQPWNIMPDSMDKIVDDKILTK